jgi:hypothetical protein
MPDNDDILKAQQLVFNNARMYFDMNAVSDQIFTIPYSNGVETNTYFPTTLLTTHTWWRNKARSRS